MEDDVDNSETGAEQMEETEMKTLVEGQRTWEKPIQWSHY